MSQIYNRHGYSNNMTLLLNKIENRLGVSELKLPDNLKKERWADQVIIPDTLVTYSRYYPHIFPYRLTSDHPQKNGWYLIDEEYLDGVKILGVKDIDWKAYSTDYGTLQTGGYGYYDNYSLTYGVQDIMLLQMRADINSMYNTGLYVEFQPPNMVRIECATSNRAIDMGTGIPIELFVEHSPNLTTLSATQMETFEALAQADIAGFLYGSLKYYEGVQTVYATIDLKLDMLRDEASKRDDVITTIKESYVSASNRNQPILLCI